MRLFLAVVCMVLVFSVAGCGSTTTLANGDWNEVLASYPDSAFWKGIAEFRSENVDYAEMIAVFNARSAIYRELNTPHFSYSPKAIDSIVSNSVIVLKEVKEMKSYGYGYGYMVKVLVVASKTN